jgi:hypothetical protein
MANKYWTQYVTGEITVEQLCKQLQEAESLLLQVWELVKTYDTRPNVSAKILEVLESAD